MARVGDGRGEYSVHNPEKRETGDASSRKECIVVIGDKDGMGWDGIEELVLRAKEEKRRETRIRNSYIHTKAILRTIPSICLIS